MANIVETTLERAPDRLLERNFASILLWVIVALTLSMLLWAWLATVDEVVHGNGRVVPSSRLQVVSNLEGGVVAEILVRAGDRVKAGQPLLRLDATQMSGEYARSDTSLDALRARAARLEAEARGRPLVFPADIRSSAPELVANEQALHAAQLSTYATERAIASSRLQQAERGLAEAEAERAARQEALAQAEREVEVIAPLVEKGVEPKMSLVRARSAASQAASQRDGAALAARRAVAARAEAQSALRGVEDRFRAEASEALATTRAEIAAQSETMPMLADRLRRTVLTAPVSGIVNRVLVSTVGGSIRPGEPLVEVVPVEDSLVVEALIAPADIGFVHVGQPATVKISAYDYSVFGSLPGRVEQIAPDALVDERTGESHFTVRVRTDETALSGEDGARLPISPGMTAEVDVLGRERSVLNYLLTPLTRLRDTAFREKL
jgi:adhesin transport system membrane fusion protein